MTSTVLRTAVVLVTALLLQVAVAPWLTIAGVQVDLLLLVGIAAGLAGGPERGARVGFVAGILWDLVVAGPFGLSALTYCLAGYFVGSAQRSVVGPTWWAPIPGAALAAGAAVLFYAAVGVVLGHSEWLDGQTLKVGRRGRLDGRGSWCCPRSVSCRGPRASRSACGSPHDRTAGAASLPGAGGADQ